MDDSPLTRSLRNTSLEETQEERFSDPETRAEHARDTDLNTGDHSVGPGQWNRAPRGMKLRTINFYQVHYRDLRADRRGAYYILNAYLKALTDDEITDEMMDTWDEIYDDLLTLEAILVQVNKLEREVLEETAAGWKWREGLQRQMVIKREMTRLSHILSFEDI